MNLFFSAEGFIMGRTTAKINCCRDKKAPIFSLKSRLDSVNCGVIVNQFSGLRWVVTGRPLVGAALNLFH